jgi:hypothetical protein
VRAEPSIQEFGDPGELGAEPMFAQTMDGLSERPWPVQARTTARPAPDDEAAQQTNSARQRLILLIASGAAVVLGMVAPALFWVVARPHALFGDYRHGQDPKPLGPGTLLHDYFGMLGHLDRAAWFVALGPLLMVGFGWVVWWTLLRPRPA